MRVGTVELLRRQRRPERLVRRHVAWSSSLLAARAAVVLTVAAVSAGEARAVEAPAPDPYPSKTSAPAPAPDPYPSATAPRQTPEPEPAPAASTTRSSSESIAPRSTKPAAQTPSRKAGQRGAKQTPAVTPRSVPQAEKPKRVAAPAPAATAARDRTLVHGGLALLALVLASGSLLYLVTRADGWGAKT